MKILYSFNLYQQHGGENQWYHSEPDLFAARGHEVSIYERDNADINGFNAFQKAALLWRTAWQEDTYRAVRARLRQERPDVVHVYNTLVLISPSIFHACRDEGVPVVQTLYNYRPVCPAATLLRDGHICEECIDHSLLRSVWHACYRESRVQSAALAWSLYRHRNLGTWRDCVSAFIVPTPFMRTKLAAGGLPAKKIVVKPNWHEPDPGARTGAGERTALFVGRLSVEKGILLLLETWRAAAALGSLPPLRVIGDGPLRGEVEAFVAAHPDAGVRYLGRMPHGEVIGEFKRAGCLLIPALWYEAFPHTILEACACAVPIVASRLGTLADVIDDERTGLLFPPGDADGLATQVRRLFDGSAGEALRARLGAGARVKYLRDYTGESAYARLSRIYEDAVADRIGQPDGAAEAGKEGLLTPTVPVA